MTIEFTREEIQELWVLLMTDASYGNDSNKELAKKLTLALKEAK